MPPASSAHTPNTPLMTVGAGRANEGLRADWQRQLQLVKDEIGFKYIRFHGLLSDDMGVYTESRDGTPHLQLAIRGPALRRAAEDRHAAVCRAGLHAIRARQRHQDHFLVEGQRHAAQGLRQMGRAHHATFSRTGRSATARTRSNKWYFEIWNEPDYDGFWSGNQQHGYFDLYAHTAAAVKASTPPTTSAARPLRAPAFSR